MGNATRLITLSGLLLISVAAAAADKVYRWVDDQGVVHFGDRVPPEYADNDRAILNEAGIAIDQQEGARTAEERAAEQAAAAAADAARAELEARQLRDSILLDTYLSVAEIESLRDQRMALVNDQIRMTELYLGSLRDKREKLQAEAAKFRPYSSDPNAPAIHENLARELSDTLDSIISYEKNLADGRERQARMSTEFEADIQRFRELRGTQQAGQ
jgi:hypothetical protein